MTDSFFTNRNQYDEQIGSSFSTINCEQLVEASVRRIVKLEGPIEASKRLQRVADICAGAYVLPIDHWQKSSEVEKAEPKQPKPKPRGRLLRLCLGIVSNPGVVFWTGFFLGIWWAGFSR